LGAKLDKLPDTIPRSRKLSLFHLTGFPELGYPRSDLDREPLNFTYAGHFVVVMPSHDPLISTMAARWAPEY
jgi:hypothetical protein